MDISCAFPPVPETADHIALAERLGYRRAWVYDTPALQLDVWATLARAADRTRRIELGPGVLIPSLRHVLVTAAAIATLVVLAPGRVNVGIGSGFTGRLAMGQRPNSWKFVRAYLRQLKALLAGEVVEVDGAATRMIHGQGQAPPRPLRVPFVIGTGGPKGEAVARELGDGIFTVVPVLGFKWATRRLHPPLHVHGRGGGVARAPERARGARRDRGRVSAGGAGHPAGADRIRAHGRAFGIALRRPSSIARAEHPRSGLACSLRPGLRHGVRRRRHDHDGSLMGVYLRVLRASGRGHGTISACSILKSSSPT